MNRIHRERWIRLGPVKLGFSLPISGDRRLARSAVVRALIGCEHRSSRESVAAFPPEAAEPLSALRPQASDVDRDSFPLIERVAHLDWYHSIDLSHGVTTPGAVDYRHRVANMLPESLAGKRCLDVMTKDGFWAFEMEKRGAAEVVAIDVARVSGRDMPARVRAKMLEARKDQATGNAFRLAREALGSRVDRREMRVYDVSPDVLGKFDFIFVGDVLLGLRDPQLALDQIRSVCAGTLYIAETYHGGLEPFGETCLVEYPMWSSDEAIWWFLSANTIRQMLRTAGFDEVFELARFKVEVPDASAGSPRRHRVLMRATSGVASSNGRLRAEQLSPAK